LNTFRVNRDLPEGRYRLREVFSGLESCEVLVKCIGNPSQRRKIFNDSYVTLTPDTSYMYINDEDGSLVVGLNYLRTADTRYLYLDIIHELVHLKQFLEGKNLFDESYTYVDRPTELEAYQCSVQEARRIGMDDDTLAEYLYVEWITRKEHARLLEKLGVKPNTNSA